MAIIHELFERHTKPKFYTIRKSFFGLNKTEFDLVVEGNNLQAMKLIHTRLRITLGEAKEFLDNVLLKIKV